MVESVVRADEAKNPIMLTSRLSQLDGYLHGCLEAARMMEKGEQDGK